MHAAHVVREARKRSPDLRVSGIGGDELGAAGVEILHHVRDMAVMGLAEVIRRYGYFKRVFDEMVRVAESRRPDAVLLVDYPGFNLRFARAMHERGIKVLYYVCPQVWAWHRSRVPRMAQIIDRLMVIFPFEVEVFSGTGLRVDFVGHPLVDEAKKAQAEPIQALPWGGSPKVALLPGSRRQEIYRILLPMLGAAAEIERKNPHARFLLAAASPEMADACRALLATASQKPSHIEIMTGATRQILRQASAAMVASGTATVEAALMGCPMIVVYKTAPLTYFFGRMLVRVPHLGMVNLIAGRELCPEFIQHAATPRAMADALRPLLSETEQRNIMVRGLREVTDKLGGGGAAARAASIILEELGD